MTDNVFFQSPAILIHIDEQRDKVVCRTYSSDRRLHSNAPVKFLAPELLPVLLYQLLRRGYHLQPYEQEVEVYIAMSSQFMERQREMQEMVQDVRDALTPDTGGSRR